MTKSEIEKLNNQIITEEQMEEVECSEVVDRVESLGPSWSHTGCTWYSVEFTDGDSVDVFM